MLSISGVLWFAAFILTALQITAKPRNSRQAETTKACGSRVHLRDPQGTVSSPDFPGPFPANSSCTWILTPPQTANLSLRFTFFNIVSISKQCGGRKCRCDFVQVKELGPQNASGFNTKFCNDNRPKMNYNLKSRVRIRFVSDSPGIGIGFSLKYDTVTSRTNAPTSFDFTGEHAKAALRSGTRGGAALFVNQTESPVNQTAIATTAATTNITDTPTQSVDSQNYTSSGVDIPLSAFTSQAPMNLTTATDAVIQLTSESIEQPGPTSSPRTFPATGVTTRDSIWTSTTHVVMAVEDKKVEEKVPDIIILGPSVPVVMIFVLVVAGIAWWNYKFNSEELNRYESYAQSNKAKRHNRHMKNISKGNLYNRMTKDWRGQSFSVTTRASPMAGRKISFAGKLRELAEGVRTPRPSPAHSEETIPLNKPATVTPAFLTPGATSTGGGSRPSSRPSSRPASLLLRDALINMFSGGESGDIQDSGPPSKRASKRVSFIDEEAGQPLVQHEASPPEQIQGKHDILPVKDNKATVEEAPAKPRRMHIPAIIVRQPSEDVDYQTDSPSRRRRQPQQEFFEPEVFCEDESDDLEAALPENDGEEPGTRDDHE